MATCAVHNPKTTRHGHKPATRIGRNQTARAAGGSAAPGPRAGGGHAGAGQSAARHHAASSCAVSCHLAARLNSYHAVPQAENGSHGVVQARGTWRAGRHDDGLSAELLSATIAVHAGWRVAAAQQHRAAFAAFQSTAA